MRSFIVVICICISTSFSLYTNRQVKNDEPSEGWKEASRMFLSSINVSVDPCQNFYKFTCDNYIAKHPLDGAPSQSTFGVLQSTVFANLTKAFESFTSSTPRTKKVVKDIYTACKKANVDNYKGAKVILDLTNEYGGWPLLNPTHWDPSKIPQNLYWVMGDMFTKHGVATLMVPQVDIDTKNVAGNNLVYLDQANLAIPAEYYRSPNLTKQYQAQLRNAIYLTAVMLASQNESIKLDEATIHEQIDRMVQLEYNLAMISVPADQRRNTSIEYNPYTIPKSQQEFPAINWASYFDGLLKSIYPDPSQVLNPFIIDLPNRYVKQLNTYLDQVNQNKTLITDLTNYLIFRLISPYMQFAGPSLSKISAEFRRSIRIDEFDDTDTRELTCVSYLTQSLPWATGRMYIDASFESPNRDDVSVMINNVLSAFSSALSGLRWMDNVSALKAFNKVQGLVRNVAYPDFGQNDQELDKYYAQFNDAVKDIDVNGPQALFQFVRQIVLFNGQSTFGQLKQKGNRIEFLMSPAIVNAWYQPERNSITFPAAILNQPFYRYDFPQAVNYGGLGVVMGHELSHGFDDQGVQFDFDGTLNTWMTPHAETGFDQMAQCVVDEYGKFCYPQSCINGITTQGENIGDNGGLKAAYRAYKAYTASHGEEAPLPGLENYTMDQIFFLSFGHVWCGSYSDDALTRQLLTNPHSPGKDRVIGAVQNFPKFAEAFKCKQGDPMYPKSACDVW